MIDAARILASASSVASAATSSAAPISATSSATASPAARSAASVIKPAAVSAVTASCAAASSTSPAAIRALTAAAAAASSTRSEAASASAASALAATGRHRGRLGSLRPGDHLRGLLHRGDLGRDGQAGIPGQEVVTDQRAARGRDGIDKRPSPQVLDQQEGNRCSRVNGVRQGLHAGDAEPAGSPAAPWPAESGLRPVTRKARYWPAASRSPRYSRPPAPPPCRPVP